MLQESFLPLRKTLFALRTVTAASLQPLVPTRGLPQAGHSDVQTLTLCDTTIFIKKLAIWIVPIISLSHPFVSSPMSPACADDTSLISCYPDPCSVTRCPAHPDAECVADYCGGCNARFYNTAGEQITNCEGGPTPRS